jgi:hypothetical protein
MHILVRSAGEITPELVGELWRKVLGGPKSFGTSYCRSIRNPAGAARYIVKHVNDAAKKEVAPKTYGGRVMTYSKRFLTRSMESLWREEVKAWNPGVNWDKDRMQATAERNGQAMGQQNVKKCDSAKPKKQALSPPRLERTTFKTSREMDFFSAKELVTQTGHEISDWPLVIVKELVDNALDACEEADIQAVIDVIADPCGITVKDNGAGLPEDTLKGALDFTIRASNREAYVAPDRGAQGNALHTLVPMPQVIDPDHGAFIVEAHGKRHVITCGADSISQRAVIHDDVTDAKCKNPPSRQRQKKLAFSGTEIRIQWAKRLFDGGTLWPFNDLFPCSGGFPDRFRMLVEGFAVFNPHATICLDWFGTKTTWKATKPAWEKWKPCRPTSTHWYEVPHLERLIGAYITHDREAGNERLVSDFLQEFDGLSGSQKRTKILRQADLLRVKLSAFDVGGRLDSERIARLLAAMQQHTRPVKSAALGIIGEDHLRSRLLAMGVTPESFRYARKLGQPKCKKSQSEPDDKASFLPWVLESAFGYLGPNAEDSRKIYAGANWSAAIKNPFRTFGDTGEGLETTLADLQATRNEPIVFVLHLVHPRIAYTDRGKSALVIGGAS